jgi:hypothetical protein
MTFCTYAHTKPDGTIFYIGKGSHTRAHSAKGRNVHWNNVVNKYGSFGVDILANWKTEEDAFSHEILLISCFRDMGYVLANISEGGLGSKGFRHTEEHKETKRQQMLASNPMSNPKFREKQLTNLKAAMQRPEVRKKQSKARLGKPLPKAHVENLKLCHPMRPVVINGINYISLMEASRQLNILHATIKRWCNNQNVKHTGKYEHIKECRWL